MAARLPKVLTQADEYRRLVERNREILASGVEVGGRPLDDASRQYRERILTDCAAWLAENASAVAAAEAEIAAARAARAAQRQANRQSRPASRPNPYAHLPRVLYVTDRSDAGEYGAALCPHCGAEGRYIYHFVCEDGTERGAMAGCFKQFPQHPFATKAAALIAKQADYREKGWALPSWDEAILDAIHAFGAQSISEQEAQDRIRAAERTRDAYRARRYGRC